MFFGDFEKYFQGEVMSNKSTKEISCNQQQIFRPIKTHYIIITVSNVCKVHLKNRVINGGIIIVRRSCHYSKDNKKTKL